MDSMDDTLVIPVSRGGEFSNVLLSLCIGEEDAAAESTAFSCKTFGEACWDGSSPTDPRPLPVRAPTAFVLAALAGGDTRYSSLSPAAPQLDLRFRADMLLNNATTKLAVALSERMTF
jgi:hypothetical protein